eukprot:5024297-Prymnesium_polylepis.3
MSLCDAVAGPEGDWAPSVSHLGTLVGSSTVMFSGGALANGPVRAKPDLYCGDRERNGSCSRWNRFATPRTCAKMCPQLSGKPGRHQCVQSPNVT